MKKAAYHRALYWCGVILGLSAQSLSLAQPIAGADCRSEIEKADRVDKSGPLAVFQLEDEKVLIEIKSEDLGKEFIFANYVDRGVAPYVGKYAEPKLITFRLNNKKIEIIQKDSVTFFNGEEALGRTRALTMSDAVIASLKLHDCQSADTNYAYIDERVLTNLSSDFIREFYRGGSQSEVGMKGWRAFSDNINFISEHRISGSTDAYRVSSASNFSIQVRHIFMERPQGNFTSREEDSRIGYFTVHRKNLSDIDQSASLSYIHKWRLEKENPEKAISDPVKPIVFWIENTTPEKFRPYIEQGVLAWNEAFRAAGFSNAIEVYEQPDDADWEAGDISKNVIRWQIAYNERENIGVAPAMHDPVTGEILGADILLNYAGIGDYVDDWSRFSNEGLLSESDTLDFTALKRNNAFYESSSNKISNEARLKLKTPTSDLEGSYILASLVKHNQSMSKKRIRTGTAEKIESSNTAGGVSTLLQPQKTSASETLDTRSTAAAGEYDLAERMLKEVIIQLTMHEVGHALGLMHNFRGSRWRSIDEIFDREKTNGVISASVMDYLPINFSPIGVEQGDFANTRLGPYDIWAIEFGYRSGLDEAQRNDLLERSSMPEHAFNQRIFGNDPYTLANDLTNAPIDYARLRLKFTTEASRLASSNGAFGKQNQYLSLFQELRFQILIAIGTISSQVTPYVSDVEYKGGNSSGANQAVNVHSKATQQNAIKALAELVFADDALSLSEEFLLRLGDNFYIADALHMQAKRTAMSQLMNEHSLLFRHHIDEYGDQYNSTELLFDIKHAIFGSDLAPFARPSKGRRDQQLLFANYLAGLINEYADMTGGRSQSRYYEKSIVSAAARPVRDALLRELLIPTPWAPSEVRAHRQELRAILH